MKRFLYNPVDHMITRADGTHVATLSHSVRAPEAFAIEAALNQLVTQKKNSRDKAIRDPEGYNIHDI